MISFKKIFALVGRMLISAIFIFSAMDKIFEWQKSEAGIINLFCDWQSYISFSPMLSKLFSALLSWVPEILIVITILELVAALMIFFGIKEKVGAFLLILFFIPATILLHPFWFLQGAKKSVEMIMFLKNVAILGGLLFLMIFGAKIKNNDIISPSINTNSEELDGEN